MLEAARLLSKHSFKYSIWFVFTAAEEQGSMGSKYMAAWLKQQGLDVRGVIAPDMIGYWPKGEGDQMDILGDTASSMLVEHMANVADQVVLRGDPAGEKWLAFWLGGGRVLAGMNVNDWDAADGIKKLAKARARVDPARLADPDVPLDDVLGP